MRSSNKAQNSIIGGLRGEKVSKVVPTTKGTAPAVKSGKKGVSDRLAYLSWSKLALWEMDKEKFRQVYFEGMQIETYAMAKGKNMAEAMELGSAVGQDPIIQQGLLLFPQDGKAEHEIKVDCGACPILGKIDRFNLKNKTFREYKTGRWPWTQKKVNDHGQITFYYYLIWLKYKVMPKIAWLDWLCTDEQSDDYGKVKSFPTVRSMSDLIKMHGRIKRAWMGIRQMAKEYEKSNVSNGGNRRHRGIRNGRKGR